MERSIWYQGVIVYYPVICIFMECTGSVVCMQFVFLVSSLVLPGISCDKLDDWLIA